MRLGKIEKFILRYLWYYRSCAYRKSFSLEFRRAYRSQILFVLFNVRHKNYKFTYRGNLKKWVPESEYNRLQAVITRSTKSLQEKGFIEREKVKSNYFKLRRYAFFLTEEGLRKARQLIGENPIRNINEVYR